MSTTRGELHKRNLKTIAEKKRRASRSSSCWWSF